MTKHTLRDGSGSFEVTLFEAAEPARVVLFAVGGGGKPISLRPALLQDTALQGAAEEKSTPETLTTACHAASWLARS
jgi:hypothetical protein